MFGSGFGQQANNNVSSFGFGQTNQPANNTGSIFGQPAQPSPFGQPAPQRPAQTLNSPFGNVSSSQVGGTAVNTGLNGTGLGAGLGGSALGNSLGQLSGQSNRGTAHTPFTVTEEKDTKSATAKYEKYQSILAMPQYQNTSLQELRFQDYQDNRKGPTTATAGSGFAFGQPQPATNNVFGQASQSSPFGNTTNNPSPFNSSTSTFGSGNASGGIFGQTSNNNNNNTGFGGPNSTFGSTQSNATGFGFGSSWNNNNNNISNNSLGGFGSNNSNSLFGKPAVPSNNTFGQTSTSSAGFGTGAFGSTNNNVNSPFGQNISSGTGLFGQNTFNNNNSNNTGAFGQNKPSLFGSNTGSTAPFGTSQQGNSLFGNSSNTNNMNNSSFGSFGQNNNNTNNAASSGLFGNNNALNSSSGNSSGFGQNQSKPIFGQTQQSSFGFGNTQQNKPGIFGQTSSPFGQTNNNAGNSLFNNNNNKPAGTGLFNSNTTTTGFGANNQSNNGTSLFGSKPALGGGFQTNTNNTSTNMAGTGSTGAFNLGANTKPTGLFGSNTGTSLFGQNNNMTTNNSSLGNSGNSLFGNNNQGTTTAGNAGGFGTMFNNSATNNSANNIISSNNAGAGSSLFGKPAGTALFGQGNTTSTTGSLFGNNNTNTNNNTTAAPNTSGTSLFGGSQTNQGGGLFGNKPSGSNLFGSTSVSNAATGLFNNNSSMPAAQQSGSSSSLFGNTSHQPSGPVALLDSDAYLSNPLFANIKQPSNSTSSNHATAIPKKESASFKAPTGMLMAQVMQPRALPKGKKLDEISVSKQIESSDDVLPNFTTETTAPAGIRPTSKFRNVLFSNNTDDIILNTDAFNFTNNNRKRITLSVVTPSTSSDSKEPRTDAVPLATSISTPSKGRSVVEDEEFSVITPTGAGLKSGEKFDFTEMRCSDIDDSEGANEEVVSVEKDTALDDLNNKTDLPDNEVVDSHGYWISPCNRKIINMTVREIRNIKNFRVGQRTQGFVEFLEPVDLSGFSDIHQQVCGRLIVFSDRSFCLYPVESERPPVGKGFNVKHQVTLYNIFAHSRETQEPIKDPDHPVAKKFLKRLKAQNNFVSWSAQTGTWTFEVDPAKL